MRRYLRGLIMVFIISQASCTQIDFAAVNLPTHFDDIQVNRDIAFGPRKDETLDIYLPAKQSTALQTYPVIVFFYGGRWETGDKSDYAFVGATLAAQNFIVVIPNYRKYPAVKFPAFVEDAAAAINWTSDHIAGYNGDAAHINVAGHSAGGLIAALAVTDPIYLKALGKNRSIVKSFVGLAGPYDFVPDEKDLIDMFGPPFNYPNMQVTHFVDGKEPPMLLMQGDQDQVVNRSNLNNLAVAIRRKGGCVETKIYSDIDHAWLIGTFSWLGKSDTPVVRDMMNFFNHPECTEK